MPIFPVTADLCLNVSAARAHPRRTWRAWAVGAALSLATVATPAHAEALLVVDLLDMARDGDQAAALLGVIAIDRNEEQFAESPVLSGACTGPVPEDINADGACYAVQLRDSHLQISNLRSDVVAQLGNTDYLLLRWRTSPVGNASAADAGGRFFQAQVGYNGFYNGNQGEFFDLSRLPGELNPNRPYAFLQRYYDDRLNQIYRHTLAAPALRPEHAETLRQAQREWLKKTQAICDAPEVAEPETRAKCIAERSAQRVWEIKALRLEWGVAKDLT